MKRIMSFFFTAFIVTMCVITAVPVFSIGQQINVRYGTPAIDGYIDKCWYNAERVRLTNITAGEDYKGRLPGTSYAYVSVMYDEDAIYFLFEISDDDFNFDAGGRYRNDSINIFIDEKGVYGSTWQDGQSLIQLVPDGDNPIRILNGKEPKYSQVGYRFNDYECIIEYKYVPSEFKAEDGKCLLVDFSFEDINEDGELSYRFTWSDEIGEGEADSSNWSYLNFGNVGNGNSHSGVKEAAAALGVTPLNNFEFYKGSNGNHNEGADKLWDGKVDTKFCTGEFPISSSIKCDQKYYVTAIMMATANDNKEYPGRIPSKWSIEGSNDGKKWEEIVAGDNSFFEDVNFTYFSTAVDSEKAYRYFSFNAEGAESGCFQLSELTICGTTDKNGVNANADKEELVQPIVPGGTIAEQISSEYGKLYDSTAYDVDIDADDEVQRSGGFSNNLATTLIIVFLSAVVVVILYLQDVKNKK